MANEKVMSETSSSSVVNAPIEFIDIPTWLFTINDAEFQRCSPAHVAAGATHADDGRRVSINVEVIGGNLLIQHYVEDVSEKTHCRVVSITDVISATGRTKTQVIWELTAKSIDANTCEFTCRVEGAAIPEFLEYIGKNGVPLETAAQARQVASAAHVAQETPFYARSIERKALEAMARARV